MRSFSLPRLVAMLSIAVSGVSIFNPGAAAAAADHDARIGQFVASAESETYAPDRAYKFNAVILGYPSNKGAGQVMKACAGDTVTRNQGAYKFVSANGCDFGGGASGGPWLDSFNASTRMGNLRTVTSWGPQNSTAHMNGPFFRTDVRTMFNLANKDT